MFDLSHRRTLRHLDSVLLDWAQKVPKPALKFHKERVQLHGRVLELLATRWPFSGRGEVDRLRAEVERQGSVVDDLVRLRHEAIEAEGRGNAVYELAERLGNETLTAKADEWATAWRTACAGVGATYEDEQRAFDRTILARVNGEIVDRRQACELLHEARVLISRERGNKLIAPVADRYESWVGRICDQGATAEIRVEMANALQPHRPHQQPSSATGADGAVASSPRSGRDTIAEPAVGDESDLALAAADRLMSEARRWPGLPQALRSEWIGLQDRSDLDRPVLLAVFVPKVKAWIEERRGEARNDRAGQLLRFRAAYEHYRGVVGAHPDLAQLADGLSAMAADSPVAHGDWMESLRQANERLVNRATNDLPALVATLRLRVEASQALLTVATGAPASQEQSRDFEKTRNQFDRVAALCDTKPDARELLDVYATLDHWHDEVERVRTDAAALLRRLQARHEGLVQRASSLQSASAALGLVTEVVPVPAWSITERPSLDFIEADLAAVEQRVAAIERAFRSLASAETGRLAAEIARVGPLLRSAPIAHVAEVMPGADDESPAAVADHLLTARQMHAGVLHRLIAERDALVTAAAQAVIEIDNLLTAQQIVSVNRDEAVVIKDGLDPAVTAAIADPILSVERLVNGLRAWRALRDRLRGSEDRVREREHAVRARLKFLATERLEGPYPRLAERCHALVDGIPWSSGQWETIATQITEAERLTELVIGHGMRLAAADLEHACDVLTKQGGTSGERDRITHALAEVAACGDARRFPPFPVRERIMKLAERHGRPH